MKTGLHTFVYVDCEVFAKANSVLAMNLAPKYTGPRNGWYGAREIKHDPQTKVSIFIVYDFDYYANNMI